MKKYILQIIALVFLFSACEQTIDFNGKESDPVTIMNGLFTPDSVFSLAVSETKHITHTGPIPNVENAVVEVFSGDDLVETLSHQNNGIYKGSKKPEAGKSYKVDVSYNKNKVSAKAEVPATVAINKLTSKLIYNSDQGEAYLELNVQFTDPAKVSNYYRITVLHKPKANESPNHPYVSSNDIVMNATYGGNENGLNGSIANTYLIFNDKLIKGKQYEVKLQFTDYNAMFAVQNDRVDLEKDYKVYLHSISEEYFLYLKSRALSEYTNDDPFSEPVPIYSNVNGGGGVLAGSSVAEAELNIVYPGDLFP